MTLHITDDRDALLDYLYDEGDPAERLKIARHLQDCAECSVAVLELRSVRGMLADWTPPPATLGFRIVQDAGPKQARWWKPAVGAPAWSQAAAAAFLFAAGMAVSQLDVQYGDGAVTVRPRSAAPVSSASTLGVIAPVAVRQNDIPLAAETPSASESRTASSDTSASDANDVLRRVRAMLDQSEAKQQRELALRLADVVRDFDAQRRADLLQVQQNLGQIEGQTGEAVARNRDLLNYIVRTSSTRQQ
ncbi:MAG: zf-HC2 domain-containing protein [Vicinamibacterales bacterium]|nr:zf-HC2 domain-containing protein [Vicinamibacterales bacterium]